MKNKINKSIENALIKYGLNEIFISPIEEYNEENRYDINLGDFYVLQKPREIDEVYKALAINLTNDTFCIIEWYEKTLGTPKLIKLRIM